MVFKKSKTTKWRKIKSIEKDGEHSMTVTGALPPCGKIKAKTTCCRIKGAHFGCENKSRFPEVRCYGRSP